MPINVYTGLMGSGKSYEVTGTVIVKAVSEGRRVVTNIEGIQPEKIKEYVKKKFNLTDDKVGEVVVVTDDEVKRSSFFPTDDPEHYSIVKGGDLVAIDEAWKFWSSGSQLLPSHMEFFRKHRHYVNPETKVSCDLALMIQDISDLNKSLKNVVEMTFRTVKLKSLGFTSKYRVEFYEGTRLMKKNQVGVRVNNYDKEIFPLYQSYAGGKGVEKTVDNRQNLWNNKTLWFIVAGLLVCALIAFNFLWKFFHPVDHKSTPVPVSTAVQTTAVPTPPSTPQVIESNWRIVGEMNLGEKMIVLQSKTGQIRVEHPSNFTGNGLTQTGKIDNQSVFRYTEVSKTQPGESK
jgi:zona occludens toxin